MAAEKKQKTEGDVEAGGEEVDEAVLEALQKLEDIQGELEQINDEASDKVLAVEQEYNKKRRPVYQNRNSIIAKVPKFWVETLRHHPMISQMLTEDDSEVLEFCTELDVEDFEDIKSGYRLTFRFSPENPFFSETELIKELKYAEDGSLTVSGTVPTWADGMGPADQEPAVGSKRPNTREYRLMNWFVEREELEPGQHDELADTLKEDVWPNPAKYYGATLSDLEDEELMLGDDGEELEGDEEDDDDDAPELQGFDGEEGEEGAGEGELQEGDEEGA